MAKPLYFHSKQQFNLFGFKNPFNTHLLWVFSTEKCTDTSKELLAYGISSAKALLTTETKNFFKLYEQLHVLYVDNVNNKVL